MNYFIIINNVTVVPKKDQIYGIQKCQSKSVSFYLTQAKNSYGQDSHSICFRFDESIYSSIHQFILFHFYSKLPFYSSSL